MILPYLAVIVLVLATVYAALVVFRQKTEGEAYAWLFPDGTRRSGRLLAVITTLLFVIGCVVWFHMSVGDTARRSLKFLIPEGYSGWVRVEFEVPGEPVLPLEGGQIVLKIPSTGLLKTSSPEQFGWARDTYAFYSSGGLQAIPDSGTRRLIWGKINGEKPGSSGKRQYEEFFVGTGEQYRDQMKTREPRESGKDDRKIKIP
jgi:uncharacterized membrane protein YciS (DUF1049 family)